MEDEGDNANAPHVCNNEAFKVAPLSGANASWHKERWGDTMMDHGEDPAGNREAGEGEREEGRGGRQHGGEERNDDNINIAAIAIVTASLMQQSTDDDMQGNGGVGEGGSGEGEDGGRGRSTMKPVSSKKQSANDGGDSQRGHVEAAGD
jgi:hypothetical protein